MGVTHRTPERVRERLVNRLLASRRIRSDAVASAFRAVPRHLFLPGLRIDVAYADEAVATKWENGVAVSSASQPSMMAIMLEQLDVRPGQRVLEIGAGTGYNAALLSHLVGPAGSVTAVDIDCDLVEAAAVHLHRAGYDGVALACQDGALGYPEAAPYDRIILTVGSWDIQPAWLDQLAPGGRLLLPLAVRGSQLSVVFDSTPGPPQHLRSSSVRGCAFVRLRGAGAGPDTTQPLWDGLLVQTADASPVDADALRAVLCKPGPELAIPVPLVSNDLWDGLGLWLAVADPATCRLLLTDAAAGSALAPTLVRARGEGGTLGLIGPEGLAALVRAHGGRGANAVGFRVAVRPFGSGGRALAEQVVAHTADWVQAGSPTADELHLRAYPRDGGPQPDQVGGSTLIQKEHTTLLLDWPSRPANRDRLDTS
ncbi:MAG: methyltransferase, FxLD system [Pseudonocardia sp.]